MSDTTLPKQEFSDVDKTVDSPVATNPWSYIAKVTLASIALVVGIVLKAQSRAPEYTAIFAGIGAALGLAGIVTVSFIVLKSRRDHSDSLEQQFNDWELQAVWREWNDQLTRHLAENATTQAVGCTMAAKQFALKEAVKLAEVNPDLNLKEWHEHMITVVTGTEPSVPEEDHRAMMKVLDDLYAHYAL